MTQTHKHPSANPSTALAIAAVASRKRRISRDETRSFIPTNYRRNSLKSLAKGMKSSHLLHLVVQQKTTRTLLLAVQLQGCSCLSSHQYGQIQCHR